MRRLYMKIKPPRSRTATTPLRDSFAKMGSFAKIRIKMNKKKGRPMTALFSFIKVLSNYLFIQPNKLPKMNILGYLLLQIIQIDVQFLLVLRNPLIRPIK